MCVAVQFGAVRCLARQVFAIQNVRDFDSSPSVGGPGAVAVHGDNMFTNRELL